MKHTHRTGFRTTSKIVVLPDTNALEFLDCKIPDDMLTMETLKKREHREYNKRYAPLEKFRDILYHLPRETMEAVLTDVIFDEYAKRLPDGTSNDPHAMQDRDSAFTRRVLGGTSGIRVQPVSATNENKTLEWVRKSRASDTPARRFLRKVLPEHQKAYREFLKNYGLEDRGEYSVMDYLQEFNPQQWIFVSEDEKALKAVSYADQNAPLATCVNVLKFLKALHKKGILESIGFKRGVTAEAMSKILEINRIKENIASSTSDSALNVMVRKVTSGKELEILPPEIDAGGIDKMLENMPHRGNTRR